MSSLNNEEVILRALFYSTDYSRPDQVNRPEFYKIKKKAVAPSKNNQGEYETSVMLCTGLSDFEKAPLIKHVAEMRKLSAKASVTFNCEAVVSQSLRIIHDKIGHEKHCCIRGWKSSKEDMMEQAEDLADAISEHHSTVFKLNE